jgi:hypothetical protein
VKYESAVPTPAEVLALRCALQERLDIGITAAQDRCAEMLYTSRRAWQQWEHGDRKMHPAFWELAKMKIISLCVDS